MHHQPLWSILSQAIHLCLPIISIKWNNSCIKRKTLKIFRALLMLLAVVVSHWGWNATIFFDFPKGVSQANYTCEKPKLEQVQVIKFERVSIEMFWKESRKLESFRSSKFLQKKYQRNIGKDFNRVMSPCGVKPDKKEIIMKVLCLHMKERSRSFWHNLEVNDASVDLTDERDECENCLKAFCWGFW